MAVPRNQVAISGFVDPYAKVSDTFADLSKMYAGRSAVKEDLKLKEHEILRQVLKDKEELRRWDASMSADKLARDRDFSLRNKEYDRKIAADQRVSNEDSRKTALRNAIWGVQHNEDSYTVDAYSPQMRERLDNATSMYKTQQELATKFLNTPDKDNELLNTLSNNYRKMYNTGLLTEQGLDEKIGDTTLRLRALKQELKSIPEAHKQRRIDEFTQRQFTNPVKAIQDAISKGTGLTKEDKIEHHLRSIPTAERGKIDPTAFRSALSSVVSGVSREDLLTSEQSRVEAAREQEQNRVDQLFKWYGNSAFTRKNPTESMAEANNMLAPINDIGHVDKGNARKFFDRLLKEGIDPVFAASETLNNINGTVYGTQNFPSFTDNEVSDLIASAKSKYVALTGGGRRLTKEEIALKEYNPRSLDEILYNKFVVNNTDDPIRVDRSILDELRKGTIEAAENAAAGAGEEALAGKSADSAAPTTGRPSSDSALEKARSEFIQRPSDRAQKYIDFSQATANLKALEEEFSAVRFGTKNTIARRDLRARIKEAEAKLAEAKKAINPNPGIRFTRF